MSFNANIPTPEACILSTHVLRVADFTAADWPSATGSYALLINYAGDGVTWEPVGSALFEYDGGRDVTVSGTPTTDSLLRYETDWGTHSSGDCSWGATFFPSSAPPSGYRYEYAWSGDVVSDTGDTFAAIDPVPSETTATRAVTCTVSLVRESDSAVICSRAFSRSESLECATGWNPPVDENEWGAESSPAANCSGFPPPGPCTPPAPELCFDSTTTLRPFTIAEEDFPDCTETLTLQTKTGEGEWTNLQTGIVADTEYALDLDIAPNMQARFVSDDDTAGAAIDLGVCDCEPVVLPPDEQNIPTIPDAPTLAKSCADETITVSSPAFSEAENAITTSIQIRRRTSPDGDWGAVHTFDAEGDWDDEGVAALGEYEYSARACNAAGCSDWSSAASIALISDTLALAFQSPAEDSELTGRVLVRFTAVDAGGASDLEVFVNNALAAAPTRKSGTALNGIYTFTLDTRRAAQGAATIAIRGTGSDGCKKQIALAVTFANTRALGVLYRDFLTETAATGLQIKRLPLSIALGELDSDPSRRYWGQVGVTDDIDIEPVTSETDPADAQAAFDAMQSFPMQLQKSWPQLGANPPGSILYGIQTLNAPAPQILIRIRQEQAEQFLAYDTESAAIPKIRPISAGKFLVFAQNPDKVFVFENDALTLLADIETDEVLSNVTDAAVLGDKVYFLDSGKLYVRDNDGGAARTFQIALHSETRVPTFIETCGAKLIVLLVGATGQKTLAVAIENNQISDVWTLADAATLAWSGGDNLYIACGAKLYISASGTTAPVLVETFDADVTAIAADGATAAIGLEDGSLQVLRQGVWSEAVTPGGANISATTVALLDFEYQSALWGKSATATLFGQDSAGAYDVTRALGTFTGVATQPTGIASLARYFVEGEDDAPDDERVLIGTTGGVLLALSVARQSNASAWLHSSISDWESGAVARLIPVEA